MRKPKYRIGKTKGQKDRLKLLEAGMKKVKSLFPRDPGRNPGLFKGAKWAPTFPGKSRRGRGSIF